MEKTKKVNSNYLTILVAVYCVFTVMQNIFEMKTIGTTAYAIMGGGTIVSWITFLIMDVMTEAYGKEKATKTFLMAGIINLCVVLLAQLIIFLPGSYVDQNMAFSQIFSNGVRTIVASFIAFCVGNYVNVDIMVRMKKGKTSNLAFYFRAVVSTLVGQLLDNFIFLVVAFAPIGISVFEMPLKDIVMITCIGTCIETAIEACFVPFITIPLTKHIVKKENR